jgi:hypothetical protein
LCVFFRAASFFSIVGKKITKRAAPGFLALKAVERPPHSSLRGLPAPDMEVDIKRVHKDADTILV